MVPPASVQQPGRQAARQHSSSNANSSVLHPPSPLSMTPLPVLDRSGASLVPSRVQDWGSAIGNVEDAKLAVETLRALIADAVYLDEDAYASAGNVSSYQQRIQLQQRRIRELELEAMALRAEVEKKDEALKAAEEAQRAAHAHIAEITQEADNHQVVYQLHHTELVSRMEEIARLKAIIEGLQGGNIGS